ncbi:MAG: hypothetical protein AAF541_03575 [Pseudomonadota bacterium]
MSTKNYLYLCAGLSLVWIVGLLAVQPFADLIEGLMLLFLSTNAR